jgi:hypothetical protein
MSKVFETGHAKNVANFEKLISYCEGYGPKYNPGRESLQLKNLKSLQSDARKVLEETKTAKTQLDKATNNRNIVFEDFRTFSTRVLNAFIASETNELSIDDVKGINRKIQGKRAGLPKPKEAKTEEETEKNTISVSQQSFDNIISHYQSLYQTLQAEPLYKPNEDDLSSEGVNSKILEMTTVNSTFINAKTALQNMRLRRNGVLYDNNSGLIKTATNVKKYVTSVFGANSGEAAEIKVLTFSKSKSQ